MISFVCSFRELTYWMPYSESEFLNRILTNGYNCCFLLPNVRCWLALKILPNFTQTDQFLQQAYQFLKLFTQPITNLVEFLAGFQRKLVIKIVNVCIEINQDQSIVIYIPVPTFSCLCLMTFFIYIYCTCLKIYWQLKLVKSTSYYILHN